MNIKTILILTITLWTVNLGFGQIAFTTYHDKDGKETKNPEEAHYVKELTVLENGEVRVIEKYTSNKKTKLIGTFLSFKDKKFVGQKMEAFESGKMKSKEFYSEDGVKIDTAYQYHPNGKLKIAYQYPYKFDGKITKVIDTLILVYNDSLGKRHLVNGNGYAEIDYNNSTVEKGNFENHKRIGKWEGDFMNKKYTFEEHYENGKLVSGITKDSLNNETPYTTENFMTPPDYPNGINALRTFIGNNYQYPREAIQNRVNGTVRITFVINREGQMEDLKVAEDLGFGTGEAAIKVLKRAKKWSPGIMRGVPVRVVYALPIRLNLSK